MNDYERPDKTFADDTLSYPESVDGELPVVDDDELVIDETDTPRGDQEMLAGRKQRFHTEAYDRDELHREAETPNEPASGPR